MKAVLTLIVQGSLAFFTSRSGFHCNEWRVRSQDNRISALVARPRYIITFHIARNYVGYIVVEYCIRNKLLSLSLCKDCLLGCQDGLRPYFVYPTFSGLCIICCFIHMTEGHGRM